MSFVLAFVAVAVAVSAIAGAVALRRSRGWLAKRTLEQVIVHTTWGKSFEGALQAVAHDGLVLVAAKVVDDDLALAGDVFIPRDQVAFVQTRTA